MEPKRIIAVGDIHGCSRALRTLLDTIGPQADDLWIPLGDYVDRGPDSRGVIETLIELQKVTRVEPLLGNHEEMFLAVLAGEARPQIWLPHGGTATLDSYGFTGRLDCVPQSHRDFMQSCRAYLELDRFFFVHANYDAELPLDHQPRELLRWESLAATMPGPHVNGKIAVVGHTAERTGEIFDVGYLKCIDTYCYGGQWLTAIELNSGKIWQANQLGELRD